MQESKRVVVRCESRAFLSRTGESRADRLGGYYAFFFLLRRDWEELLRRGLATRGTTGSEVGRLWLVMVLSSRE